MELEQYTKLEKAKKGAGAVILFAAAAFSAYKNPMKARTAWRAYREMRKATGGIYSAAAFYAGMDDQAKAALKDWAKRRFGLDSEEASDAVEAAMSAWHGIKLLFRIAKNVKNRHNVD